MHYSKQRQVNESIPAKSGMADEMRISKDAKINDIGLRFNIANAKSEAVSVKLESPDGTQVSLLKKAAHKGKHLSKSIDGKDLKKFLGLKSKGVWKLHVKDSSGKALLCNWTLNMELPNPKKSALMIPDNDKKGLESKYYCSHAGNVSGLKARVDIAHAYVADLKVSLTSPSGKSKLLHNKEGGSKANLKKSYSKKDLADFKGEKAKGFWTLTVHDTAPRDAGRLKSWGLMIEAD